MTIPDLTPDERAVFALLYAFPGLFLSEIARYTAIPYQRVQKAVDDLEALYLLDTLTYRPQGMPAPRRYCYPAPWTVAA